MHGVMVDPDAAVATDGITMVVREWVPSDVRPTEPKVIVIAEPKWIRHPWGRRSVLDLSSPGIEGVFPQWKDVMPASPISPDHVTLGDLTWWEAISRPYVRLTPSPGKLDVSRSTPIGFNGPDPDDEFDPTIGWNVRLIAKIADAIEALGVDVSSVQFPRKGGPMVVRASPWIFFLMPAHLG